MLSSTTSLNDTITTQILTHRGLEPSKKDFFSESTLEALQNQLERGYGLEVDLSFTTDGIVFCHDASLKRITNGKDTRELKHVSTAEACSIMLNKGRFGSFEELMHLMRKYPNQMIALHLKGTFQNNICCDTFLHHMLPFMDLIDRTFVFDVTIDAAKYLKAKMPELSLGGSIAHPFDIERFFSATKGTLLTLDSFTAKPELFTWAWLDEWDLTDRRPDGSLDRHGKKLYTAETFDALRAHGFKIAVASPELHGTSPGLVGGESHPHASTPERLFARIEEILALKPDAICTDFPEEVRSLTAR